MLNEIKYDELIKNDWIINMIKIYIYNYMLTEMFINISLKANKLICDNIDLL